VSKTNNFVGPGFFLDDLIFFGACCGTGSREVEGLMACSCDAVIAFLAMGFLVTLSCGIDLAGALTALSVLASALEEINDARCVGAGGNGMKGGLW
jgi:hypothetical protein